MLLGQQIKDRWCRDINHMVVQDAAACLHPQPFVFPAPAASVSECESPLQLSFISSFSPYLALTFLISLFFHVPLLSWTDAHKVQSLTPQTQYKKNCVLKDKRYNIRFKEHLKSKKVVKGLFAVLLKLTPELSISRKSNLFIF